MRKNEPQCLQLLEADACNSSKVQKPIGDEFISRDMVVAKTRPPAKAFLDDNRDIPLLLRISTCQHGNPEENSQVCSCQESHQLA